uniref:Uncharacterized protein n=1 Tax=Amphiprion percula TaxID=161767 RepID=A0A3P8U5P6_AMPPE
MTSHIHEIISLCCLLKGCCHCTHISNHQNGIPKVKYDNGSIVIWNEKINFQLKFRPQEITIVYVLLA